MPLSKKPSNIFGYGMLSQCGILNWRLARGGGFLPRSSAKSLPQSKASVDYSYMTCLSWAIAEMSPPASN
jgi:hypothetical protein